MAPLPARDGVLRLVLHQREQPTRLFHAIHQVMEFVAVKHPCPRIVRDELDVVRSTRALAGFLDAHWHHQIFCHPRYKELFLMRQQGKPFTAQDIRDLAMWFNLAWFGKEFREGEVELVTGEVASVRRFVLKERGFSHADIQAMVAEQFKILRAVIPIHRKLQEAGQIEVSTTPFYHPILPLLVDTDRATIDRPGADYPPRFAYPEDAEAQVRLAVRCYQQHFGQPPRGMWPAEGAVAQFVVPLFARAGVRWIATDKGVLARSGRWGYQADDPDVLCRPYRAEENELAVSVFFRDTALSDAIGFRYHAYASDDEAAREFVREIKQRFVWRLSGCEDRILTVALDGENAWGAYRDDGRPFLHALYRLLQDDPELQTTTFSEFIEGNPRRGIDPHPLGDQTRVYDLFTGSWIDENGSAPGVDLGTWIGEEEENRAWALLGQARAALQAAEVTPEAAPAAFHAMYAAEGSDWFWWFGDDQDSGSDHEFDDLFRLHLRNVYKALGQKPPEETERHIVTHKVLWTFTQPVYRIQRRDRLAIRTNCPGVLRWRLDNGQWQEAALAPEGGVMAGPQRYSLTLGPFPTESSELRFIFECRHQGCSGQDACCRPGERRVHLF